MGVRKMSSLLHFVSAIAETITALGVVAVVIQVIIQRRTSDSEAITKIYDEIATEQFREALRFVYRSSPKHLMAWKNDQY